MQHRNIKFIDFSTFFSVQSKFHEMFENPIIIYKVYFLLNPSYAMFYEYLN